MNEGIPPVTGAPWPTISTFGGEGHTVGIRPRWYPAEVGRFAMAILCYHSVEPNWASPLAVTPGEFAVHMRWLAERRVVVDLSEAVEALDGWVRLPRRVAALTFDDGFTGVYEHGIQVLRRYRLPATVFVVGETLTPNGREVDWVRGAGFRPRTLSRSQVLELAQEGVRIGSHSFSHRDLRRLSDTDCQEDLRRSREVLEDLLQHAVPYLAYPGGRHDARVRRAAEAVGFRNAFSLPERREPAGAYSIPRIGVYRGNGLSVLRVKAARWYLPARTSALVTTIRAAIPGRSGPPG